MKLTSAFRKARNRLIAGNRDARHVNAVNNPAYRSTVVDAASGRRSVMGTGPKSSSTVLRPTPYPAGRPRTAVVLGIARGGTSMVSGVLRGLGVYMGDDLGFNHEDSKVQRIVNKQAFQRFARLAKRRDKAHSIWGFKFPEASLIMDRFHPDLRRPHYLFVLRHPLARGNSVVARTGGTLSAAVIEALETYQAIFSFLDSVDAPVLLVNYEQATANPAEFVAAVADFLGIEASQEQLARAAEMIVGEGGGYVNLPEFWFFAEEAATDDGASPALPCTQASLNDDEIAYASDRASVWTGEAGPFPKTFRLRFTLSGGGAKSGETVRLYYDYGEGFHIGHRLLLELSSREPVLDVQSTGALKRLAIVPIRDGVTVDAVAFSRSSGG